MNFKRLLLFFVAPLALMMNSCVEQGPDYSLPSIAITDADNKEVTTVNFPEAGGEQKIKITATRSWNIAYTSDWFAVNPSSDTNEAMATKVVEVTITAGANDGEARNETIKVTMDKTEKSILISQAGVGQVELGEDLYYENFDKDGKQAQKGSSGWDTYLDGAGAEFLNPTPENQSGVTYSGTKVSIRSNSANGSAGTHSNCSDVASGLNYVWFGTAPTNMTISGISLAELEGNALTLSFTTERYEYEAEDNTYKNDEFKVYISGDGEKWSEVKYTFLEGVNLNGKWNIATAQFNLKEVPETLSIHFTASVSSAYAIDDVKLTAGGGGTEIDLSQGGEISGGTSGGNQGSEPDPNAQQVTVQQFLDAAEDSTVYLLTGTISGNVTTHYGNFDLTDETGTVYVYGLVDGNNKFVWDDLGLKVGDTITIQGTRTSYQDTPQMKNALYISHVAGEGGETPEPPVVAEGDYASDSIFVQTTDDSANAAYGLGETVINGNAVTGFKLGKSKQEGKFTSKAIGVEGDKYLNFYAVSWGAGGDKTIYFRVNGGEAIAQPIKANDGAAQNAPYNNLTPTENDHYSVQLTGLAATDVIEFSTNAAFDCATTTDYATRAIFFGVKLTDEALGGTTGGGTTTPDPEDPEVPGDVVKATVAEFLAAAEDATVYELTGEISGTYNTDFGNFYLKDASGEVLIYGIYKDGQKCYTSLGLKDGDTVTVQGARTSYNGKAQMKNAEYISHTAGQGGTTPDTPEPPVAEGDYASDAAFVCSADDSTNAAYTLGATTIGGNAATGFKLGKSKQEGKFTSAAVGVSGDLYLSFYAVAWKNTTATLYWRVNGGEVMSQELAGNAGATGNPPYTALAPTENDHYSVKLTGLTATDKIEFSTNANFELNTYSGTAPDIAPRAIVFGVKLSEDAMGGTTGGGTTTPEPEEPEEPAGVVKATVAEFLAAAEDETVYELTGTIKGTYNTFYGNFYLEDATGEVLIYGILKDGEKCYEALGLKDGDTLTIQGTRVSYNGNAQMKNAEYISHTAGTTTPDPEDPEDPEEPEQPAEAIVATIAEFIAAAESTTQWYELTGKITSIEKADYGNIYIQDETTSVLIYGLCATKVEKNDKSFASLGLKVGDTVTLHTLRTSYNGTAQGGGTPPAYYISHEEGVVVEPEVPEGSVLASAVFAEKGFSDKQNVDGQTIAIDENVSVVFKKGGASTAPTYYDNGMAIRMYQNGATLDVTANGKTITSIELTFASNMYYVGADSGELSAEAAVRTWTGSASAVKFTSTGTDKDHRAYVAGIKVTYTE